MVKRKAIYLLPLAIAAAALPGTWMGSASASGTSGGGVVHIYQVDTALNGQPNRVKQTDSVTLTGALSDYGVDYEETGNSSINVLDLRHGAIALDLSKWGTGRQPSPMENSGNCSFTNVIVGPVTIAQDKLPTPTYSPGIYARLRGTFYVKAIFAGVAPGTPDNCDFSKTSGTALDFVESTGIVYFSR